MEPYQLRINHPAPEFAAEAYFPTTDTIGALTSAELRGSWIVLFFYPADFTFVCPTELEDLANRHAEFEQLGVKIVSISTDTPWTHKAWFDHSESIRKIKYPMLADPTGNISRAYQVYIPEEGLALRGTFIIDPEGILKAYEVNANAIGRSSEELLRKIKAAQFVAQHGDQVCPANWQPGQKTLTPGVTLVGKI